MLQPRQSDNNQRLMTARIVWAALTMSMFMYGFVLFTTGKLSRAEELTSVPTTIQYIALLANLIGLVTFFIYKNKVVTEPDLEKRFPLYVLCWALNESIVLFGFIAVFLTDDGNGMIYLTNLLIGFSSNVLCFPKK